MSQQWSDQVAFVTDGWEGLGARITDSLLGHGVSVGAGFHRPDPALDEFVAAHADAAVSFHQGSMAVAEDCQRVVDELVERRGRLDILISLLNFNPAGIISTRRNLRRLPDREWQRTVEVNLSGAFYLTQAALGHMVRARYGRVVFVLGASGVGDRQGHYATIREGLRSLTRELAREVAGRGVTVNRVSTGAVDHPMLETLPEEALTQAVQRIPVRRLGDLQEIVSAVEFLAHPDSGYLTGQVLAVDGGLTLDSA
jgi:NAD(P)-dependent dehydrogenase (short-subunit alcohol dehydrogenase family)